jgi:outer membrane protein OmpA-like peptidoglycan-associated protein
MIRKIIVAGVFFSLIIFRASAQELGIEVSGGLQGTKYQLQNGQNSLLPGGSLGVNYTFRLSGQWGLVSGVMAGLYQTKATLQNGVVFTSDQVDDAGSAFQYNIKPTGYKENQQFFTAAIPLLLQYHTEGAGRQWYFNAGGKILFPISNHIKVTAQQLNLSGFYPDYNLDVSSLPQHGFGTIGGWSSSATSNFKPAAALSAATGFSFRLKPGTRLYAGVFVDYGLTDLREKKGAMTLATYSPGGLSGVEANSVLNMPNAGTVTLLSFGLQVRLSFGIRSKAEAQSKTQNQPPPSAKGTLSEDEAEVIQRPVVFGILGESAIPEVQKPHLDEVAEIMQQHPDIRISIEGHACNNGQEIEDPKVGAARAKAVQRYLQNKGIERRRMSVTSPSESDPGDPNDTGANFQSRRAAITLQ